MSQCFRNHGLYNIMMSIFVLLGVALKQHVASVNQIFAQVTMSLLEAKKGKCVGSIWIYDPTVQIPKVCLELVAHSATLIV